MIFKTFYFVNKGLHRRQRSLQSCAFTIFRNISINCFLYIYYLLVVTLLWIRASRAYHLLPTDASPVKYPQNVLQIIHECMQTNDSFPLHNYLRNPIPENCHGVLCGKYITFKSILSKNNTIIVITPTIKRYERIPDLTRLSQTLMHIKNIHWIVIEDGTKTADSVNRLLKRSNIPYAYFFAAKQPKLLTKGWTQRNEALEYLRKYYRNYEGHAVVYFADDDNAYDIRLFNSFIRNVKNVGVWPVGLVGGAAVEGPIVKEGRVVRWHAQFKPNRTFAIDMAGFGVSLKLIHSTRASFGCQCINESPEDCFLLQLGISRSDVEPFGYNIHHKDVLVWHVNTVKSTIFNKTNNGFDLEIEE